VVVDAGYPDVPQIGTFPHRVLALVDGGVRLLPPGNDRILGCTCLEYDVIRDGVRLPARIDRLQAIVVADAGAYDTSMSFDFARAGNKRFDDGIQKGAGELHSADTRDGDAARSGVG
jgi:diaminopimelate decarboxylase